MDNRNRLPARGRAGAVQDRDESVDFDGGARRDALTDIGARDGVATLLQMLTRLANCGLDAGAPPLLRSTRVKV